MLVNYEEELFTGKVRRKAMRVQPSLACQISGHHWKWPKVDDEHVYIPDEIVKSSVSKKLSSREEHLKFLNIYDASIN